MKRLVSAYSHRRGPNELALAFIAVALAFMNIGLGWSAVRASPLRFSAASFDVLKMTASMPTWGWMFIATGTVAMVAQLTMRPLPLGTSHLVAGLLCLFWAAAFRQALQSPAASVTGPWAYMAIGLTHCALGAASLVQWWFDQKAQRVVRTQGVASPP